MHNIQLPYTFKTKWLIEKFFFLHSLFLKNLFLIEPQISFEIVATKQERCIKVNHSQSVEIWSNQVRI